MNCEESPNNQISGVRTGCAGESRRTSDTSPEMGNESVNSSHTPLQYDRYVTLPTQVGKPGQILSIRIASSHRTGSKNFCPKFGLASRLQQTCAAIIIFYRCTLQIPRGTCKSNLVACHQRAMLFV